MPLARTLTKLAFHRGGGLHLVRYVNRKAVRILLYHGFPSEAASSWERQCQYLRCNYKPISLTAAVNALKAREPLPHNTVVVSVDDGYRNFHSVAYPSLKRYGIPAIVFLVSDFLDRKSWLWRR